MLNHTTGTLCFFQQKRGTIISSRRLHNGSLSWEWIFKFASLKSCRSSTCEMECSNTCGYKKKKNIREQATCIRNMYIRFFSELYVGYSTLKRVLDWCLLFVSDNTSLMFILALDLEQRYRHCIVKFSDFIFQHAGIAFYLP